MHSAPARWQRGCTRVWNHLPQTLFISDPKSTRGARCLWAHPEGHSRSPSQSCGGSASLPLCAGDLGCASPGREAQSSSHTSFQGSSSFSLSSNPLETKALGQTCFSLMDRNDACNDSPSVNSTSAAMQGKDILLLIVNSQQIPVCSFALVQRIHKCDRNQINVIFNCSCG